MPTTTVVSFELLPTAVLRTICECLIQDHDRCESQKTLVGLARTCRATHGPAADTIWHTIPDIAILLFTLPGGFWRRVEPTSPNLPSMLPECLTAKFFTSADRCLRLLDYALRVREVCQPLCANNLAIEPASLDALHDRIHQLLPHLGTLIVSEPPLLTDEYDKPRSFHQLFGRQLQVLAVDNARSNATYEALSDSSKRSIVRTPSPCAIEGLRKTIPYLRNLTILRTGAFPLSIANLAQLGTLLRLETLDVSVDCSSDFPATFNLPDHGAEDRKWIFFPVLREFTMRVVIGFSLLVPTTFLRFAQSRVLTSVKVESQDRMCADDIQEFLHVLGTHRSAGYIETLSLTEPPPSDEHHRTVLLEAANVPKARGRYTGMLRKDAFKPLLNLTGLESLTFRWTTPTMINDALLTSMATAWPDIRVLRLDEVSRIAGGRVTHKGLLSLASKCPELETLGVEVHLRHRDGASSTGPHNSATQTVVQGALTQLHVGKARMGDDASDAAALFLVKLFPGLDALECWWWTVMVDQYPECVRDQIETQRDNWGEVDEVIHAFATVRTQERRTKGLDKR